VADETANAEPEPAAIEETMIEVWRPHRQHNHTRRPDQRSQKRPQRPQAQVQAMTGEAPVAADAGQRHERNPRHNAGRRSEHRPQVAAGAEGQIAADGAADKPATHENRKDQRRGPPNRDGQNREGQNRNAHRGRNEERRGNRNDERRGTFATTEKPQSRERQPDPNSPFAKLLALKERLENPGKE